jgi:hypothetical protein
MQHRIARANFDRAMSGCVLPHDLVASEAMVALHDYYEDPKRRRLTLLGPGAV